MKTLSESILSSTNVGKHTLIYKWVDENLISFTNPDSSAFKINSDDTISPKDGEIVIKIPNIDIPKYIEFGDCTGTYISMIDKTLKSLSMKQFPKNAKTIDIHCINPVISSLCKNIYIADSFSLWTNNKPFIKLKNRINLQYSSRTGKLAIVDPYIQEPNIYFENILSNIKSNCATIEISKYSITDANKIYNSIYTYKKAFPKYKKLLENNFPECVNIHITIDDVRGGTFSNKNGKWYFKESQDLWGGLGEEI